MEHTEGLGKSAEVWVNGQLLKVCDGLSAPHLPAPAGVLKEVKFSYVSHEGFSWARACGGNPGRKKLLEPGGGYSCVGYGQVVGIMPVEIDFGLLRMEDANWTDDGGLIGRYVRIDIDRLEIGPAHPSDWPEGLRR